MRIWIIAGISLLIGLVAGWAWTGAELGFRPDGNEIAWGSPPSTITPPRIAAKGSLPKLILEKDQYDFGSIELGGIGRHAFVFKNVGTGKLLLIKGETSCVCTLSSIDHPEIPPGGSTTVEVEWHPKTRGPFRQSAQVLTNDPKRPRIELWVAGNVVSSYMLKPETIVFSSIVANASATAESRVYSFESYDLAVVDPQWADKANSKFFDLQIKKLAPEQLDEERGARSGCLLQVTAKPGLPAGPFGGRIRFHLNTPGEPLLELAIEGSVTSPVEISGPGWDGALGILKLDPVHSREGAKSTLYLWVRGDTLAQADFRLDSVEPKTLKVTVGKMEKLAAGVGRVPLVVEIPAGTPPEDHLGTALGSLARIFLDTGLPDNKQLRILVRYAVEE